MSQASIDHLAEVLAQQSTDRLLIYVLGLFMVFLILALIVALRVFPLLRDGNRARMQMAEAYHANTEAMRAVKEELVILRKSFEDHYPKSFFRWITCR